MPLGYGKLFARTDVNWAYESEPEPALNGRRIFTPRGKVLGGSSSINGLVYIRGQPRGLRRLGRSRLGFRARCCRTSRRPSASSRSRTSSATSSATRSSPRQRRSASRATTTSTARRRKAPATTAPPRYRGRRRSTAIAYLRPGGEAAEPARGNECARHEDSFRGQARRRGVEYRKRRKTARSRQTRDHSARGGAFNSPQLLQLSGVGPRALLEKHGIPVVHDAPQVGERLQDHFYVRTFWRCCKPITLNDDMASLWRKAAIGLQYLLRKTGPLTVSAGHAAAFVRTRPGAEAPGRADLLHQLLQREARRLPASALRIHLRGVAAAGRVARLGAHPLGRSGARRPRSATTISPPRTTGA